MISDIVSKLNKHLSQSVETECSVVYLLAEVRKILEKDRQSPEPFALRMYCHWALHVDLTRPNTTKHFLEKVDSFVLNNVSGLESDGRCSFLDEHHLFQEFSYLDSFREQLRSFLDRYALPTDLCDDDPAWTSFISAYAGVIEDGTLSCGTSNRLQAIQEVTFCKGRPLTSDNHLPFVIQWDIKLKDGRLLRAELEATKDLKMRSGGLHLI